MERWVQGKKQNQYGVSATSHYAQNFSQLIETLYFRHPLNCIATYKNDIIAGTALGLVLIYQEATGELLVEIAAHARCVHSLDVLSDIGLVSLKSSSATTSKSRMLNFSDAQCE